MDQQLCNQHVMFIMTTYDQFSCVKETFLELHVQVPAKKYILKEISTVVTREYK